MRELVDAFYKNRSIVNHQIASYNDFLEHRLQNIVDNAIIGQEEEMEKGFIYPEIEGYKIKFGKVSIGKPAVKEADGTIRELTPMEARLRDLTYEAPLTLEFIPVKDGVEYEPEEVRIGELPIMIKSRACNLARHTMEERKDHELSDEEYKKELQKMQEDPRIQVDILLVTARRECLLLLKILLQTECLLKKPIDMEDL